MRVGDIYRVKSFAHEAPGLTMHFAANRGEKRKKGDPQPVFVIMLLGREEDLEKPEIDPNEVLRFLGWDLVETGIADPVEAHGRAEGKR